jgi:uncharacterized membrane protein YvlD (DUF360 family)
MNSATYEAHYADLRAKLFTTVIHVIYYHISSMVNSQPKCAAIDGIWKMIINNLIMQLASAISYFLPRFKYAPNHHVLKTP